MIGRIGSVQYGERRVRIDTKAVCARLHEHPFERHLCERLSASNIAVTLRKPHLLHVDAVLLLIPQVLLEERAPLVNGDRMPEDGDAWIGGRVGKDDGIPHPAHRAHGVPDADEVDGRTPRSNPYGGFTRCRQNH